MKRRRDLIIANVAALLVLLFVLLIGWGQEAAFGLVVLVILDVLVLIRERTSRPREGSSPEDGQPPDA
jgi:hypothetical protein